MACGSGSTPFPQMPLVVVALCMGSVTLAAKLGPYPAYDRPAQIAYELAEALQEPAGRAVEEGLQGLEEGPGSSSYGAFSNMYKDEEQLGDGELRDAVLPEKRGGRLPVAFVCSPKTAGCLNGGRGPKITPLRTHKLAMCVCLCPNQLKGPRCTKVKRRFRW